MSIHKTQINYLFRRPQNAPIYLKQSVESTEDTFSVFLLSQTIVQNLNIEINITSGPVKNFALVHASTLGITLEYVRFKVDCVKGFNQTFTPILVSPQLGLFWCVFQMPTVRYITLPHYSVLH